jgi:hypothetical protein
MRLILQNIKETHSIVKVDGEIVDDVMLADGNPNIRVLDIQGSNIDVNGHISDVVGQELFFNFETENFELR